MQGSLLFLSETYETEMEKRSHRAGKSWLASVQSQHKAIKKGARKHCFIDLEFHLVWLDLKGFAQKDTIVVNPAHFQHKWKYCNTSF